MKIAWLLVFCLLATTVFGSFPRRKRRQIKDKLLDDMTKKIYDFFDFDKYLTAESMVQEHGDGVTQSSLRNEDKGCETTEEMTDYFFKVYANYSDPTAISYHYLEHMIKYQTIGYPKERLLEKRTEQFKCKRRQCFTDNDIARLLNNATITMDKFREICPVMLYNFELHNCEYPERSGQLSEWQKWVFGMLLSGVITIWSWNGAIIFPIITKKFYRRMLTFMISIAFACLTCNSLLKYIPLADGFDISNIEDTNYSYFLKHLLVVFMLFFFFIFERGMKIFAIYRTMKLKKKKRMERRASVASAISELGDSVPNFFLTENDDSNMHKSNSKSNLANKLKSNKDSKKKRMTRNQSIDLAAVNMYGMQAIDEITDKLAAKLRQDGVKFDNDSDSDSEDGEFKMSGSGRICCTSLKEGMSKVRPIGWMAIFGDGLGNFIDGLSVGASISQNIVLGITTALATWFGNIPQELGDFALLVRAGMTPFQALFYNFMSAQSAYLGCTIGIIFGSNMESARWIFSISGGATLFLGLAVLLPEMKEEFENKKETFKDKLMITFIQLLGMVVGITTMIILNMYEDDINIGGD